MNDQSHKFKHSAKNADRKGGSTLTTAKSFGQEIIEGLEDLAMALESGERISNRLTCRKVILDLSPRDYNGARVKQVRAKFNVSQSVLARFLGVSVKTVRAWEQDANPVPGVARRILDEIENNPAYFRNRLKELAVSKQRRASRAH